VYIHYFDWLSTVEYRTAWQLRLEGSLRVNAVKGTWRDDHTFVIDRLVLGQGGPAERGTLTFDGEKLNLRTKSRERLEISIDGETGG
jgi:hypothetical protein